MKRTNIILAIFLLLASNMLGQKGDWATVEELPADTPISVRYGNFPIHNRCTFENATNDKLICERDLRWSTQIFIPPDAVYYRRHIRSVRLEYSNAHNMLVGGLIGGTIGGALGAAGSGDHHAKARIGLGVILGLGGAGLGACLGRDFPIFHRQTIYKQ